MWWDVLRGVSSTVGLFLNDGVNAEFVCGVTSNGLRCTFPPGSRGVYTRMKGGRNRQDSERVGQRKWSSAVVGVEFRGGG